MVDEIAGGANAVALAGLRRAVKRDDAALELTSAAREQIKDRPDSTKVLDAADAGQPARRGQLIDILA